MSSFLCTYHLINNNLSGKTSNEKKYKKYLDFIIGWVRSWTEEIESEEEYVESFKRFEEFIGRRTNMEVLGCEICKVLDDYIAVTWIPNRETLQRHHRMEVRSME
jgi:RAB protein geranylgeranyltransferase component A